MPEPDIYDTAKQNAREAVETQMTKWGFKEKTKMWDHLANNSLDQLSSAVEFARIEDERHIRSMLEGMPPDTRFVTPEFVNALNEIAEIPIDDPAARTKALKEKFTSQPLPEDPEKEMTTALKRIAARAALKSLTPSQETKRTS